MATVFTEWNLSSNVRTTLHAVRWKEASAWTDGIIPDVVLLE